MTLTTRDITTLPKENESLTPNRCKSSSKDPKQSLFIFTVDPRWRTNRPAVEKWGHFKASQGAIVNSKLSVPDQTVRALPARHVTQTRPSLDWCWKFPPTWTGYATPLILSNLLLACLRQGVVLALFFSSGENRIGDWIWSSYKCEDTSMEYLYLSS
jgi:hypothetical protein